MANTNIINAVFGSGICAVTTSAFRANYGMVLRFSGIDLPTAFEVDFSNYDVMGRDSITMIGQNGEVQIPDDLWDSGLNIYAYVYLHPTDDSGVTVYTVTIPVLGRPNRTEEEPTPHEQSVIEQAISALNDAVEQTAADVETTTANAQAAAQSEANASASDRAAAASASAALASQNAAESASQSATESASGAAESARNAANSASQAAESATNAQASAEQAERSVQSIGDDVERAERAAATASTKANEASASATAAAQSASSASTAAQNAAESATAAESHATDAETAKQGAQDAKEAAEQASEDAEAAAVRAEQAEQEVLSSMDGTYENLTSGNAQQLLSTVTESDSVPYLFRQTAKNADRAYLDEVVGGTVAWNQMIEHGNFDSPQYWYTYQCSYDVADGVATVTPSARLSRIYRLANVVLNHKYLMVADFKGTSGEGNAMLSWYGGANLFVPFSGSWQKLSLLLNNTFQTASNWQLHYGSTANDNNAPYQIRNAQCFDLTAMLGSTVADYIYNLETATAGAGVAYFRKLFPNDYYEYNSGELLSVEGVSAKRTVGFNLFDGSVLNSLVGVSKTGNYWVGTVGNFIRSENTGIITSSVRLIEGVSYCVSAHGILASGGTTNVRVRVAYTDGTYDQSLANFIDAGQEGTAWLITDASKKISSVGFTYGSGGTASRFSLEWFCINLSDPVRNGTYEPYTKRTYPLDSSLTLHGIPKLDASGNLYYDGDTYAADGTVTRRYGVVDLGTLTWARNTQYVNPVFLASIPLAKLPLTSSLLANATCAIYEQKAATNTNVAGVNKVFAIGKYYSSGYELNVIDTSYTSASDFKTAMSGVYLVYELATPTTETATPYRHLQICDPNGTEEFMSTGIVPVGHNTRYPENLRAKIEGLPWNFNSIIAMTETTTTASKAYSVGDYFILNNVLYRVTSAIASGGTITIGTNCRATTIMDEIKALS